MKTMKNLIQIIALSLFLCSCSKLAVKPDDGNGVFGGADAKVTGSMKAKLDGKDWEAKKLEFGGALALVTLNGSIDTDNFISLEFIDTDLKLNTKYGLGTDKGDNELQNLLVKIKGEIYFATSGGVKFTKYTRGKTLSGEINGKLYDYLNKKEILLENCTFSMTYNN